MTWQGNDTHTHICIYIYGGFHKWGYPKMEGSHIMENPIKVDGLEVPPFQETSIHRYIAHMCSFFIHTYTYSLCMRVRMDTKNPYVYLYQYTYISSLYMHN